MVQERNFMLRMVHIAMISWSGVECQMLCMRNKGQILLSVDWFETHTQKKRLNLGFKVPLLLLQDFRLISTQNNIWL